MFKEATKIEREKGLRQKKLKATSIILEYNSN
jgi:hypothetical protein